MTLICGALPTQTTQITSVARSMPPPSGLCRRLLQRVLGVISLISSLLSPEVAIATATPARDDAERQARLDFPGWPYHHQEIIIAATTAAPSGRVCPRWGDWQGSSGFNGQLQYRSLSPISIDNFLSDIGRMSDPMIGDTLS